MKRISNSSFSFSLGNWKLVAEKASISIEDARKAVKDGGVPNGYVDGEVGASGEIEVDAAALAWTKTPAQVVEILSYVVRENK